MQNTAELAFVIQRIRRMEHFFDAVSAAVADRMTDGMAGEAAAADGKCGAAVDEMLRELIRYHESGLWLADYERDEKGLLPPGLKRGVLSEDGLYNLLCDVQSCGLRKL